MGSKAVCSCEQNSVCVDDIDNVLHDSKVYTKTITIDYNVFALDFFAWQLTGGAPSSKTLKLII